MWEAISIILALGLLEYILWRIDHRELKEQTTLLEEIAVSLSLRELKIDEREKYDDKIEARYP